MIAKLIEKLLAYASAHLYLNDIDKIYLRNALLRKLGASAPYEGEIDEREIASLPAPDTLIAELSSYLVHDLGYDELKAELFIEEIMGDLLPLPSKVAEAFWALYDIAPKEATDYFYDLCIKGNYIRKSSIDKNIKWVSSDGLEISINLSKPEKDNKDIRKLVSAPSTGYPKCALCLENLGYMGRRDHPARETLRIIPLDLGGEPWFFQYSPYGYYDEHAIVIKNEHVPMLVSRQNMEKLLAFIDYFPHYFIGSNSDLPITGGSILNHEHFQGGMHTMPMMKAEVAFHIANTKFPEVELSYLDFFNSAFKLVSNSKSAILDLAEHINAVWKAFADETIDLLPSSRGERHSSITSIAAKEDDRYVIYLILRNNRCDEKYPDGIFHAHPEYHHIKKEGIGLIEAMGLFILPPRLKRQSALIEDIIAKGTAVDDYVVEHPDLLSFVPMIEHLKKSHGKDIAQDIREDISDVCKNILIDTSVFKSDAKGRAALMRFISALGVS